MENLEVIQLATMSMHPERDVDGKKTKHVSFKFLEKNMVASSKVPTEVRCYSVKNPFHGDPTHYEWYLPFDIRNWLADMNLKYQLWWRETTYLPTWYSPRYYILELSLPSANAAMLFKLAWGGK